MIKAWYNWQNGKGTKEYYKALEEQMRSYYKPLTQQGMFYDSL